MNEEEKEAERQAELKAAKGGNDDLLDTGDDKPKGTDKSKKKKAAKKKKAVKAKKDTPPDTDNAIVEDEKVDDDKKTPEYSYIIVKSRKKGVLFAQPSNTKGARAAATGRSMTLQEGYNEVRLDVWEECRAEMLAHSVKEFGRKTDSEGVVTAKAFNHFETNEQRILAGQCMNTETLKRWQGLPNIDAAVMTVITERLNKIKTYQPAKG